MVDMIASETVEEDLEQIEEEAGQSELVIDVEEGSPWNPIEEAFLRRRSVRKYKKKQVPAHLIRRALEIGRFAPSQGNCQPWKFVVVRDRKMIDEMENYCVGACKKMAGAIDYTAHEKGTFARFKTRAMAKFFTGRQPNAMHPVPFGALSLIAQGRFAVFHHAPTVIFLLMDKRGIGHPEIDIGICGTNIVMAAQSLGLATCWVGFAAFLGRSPEWCERLGVEEPYELIEAIVVGYALGKPSLNTVSRETHEIAWYENGEREILF